MARRPPPLPRSHRKKGIRPGCALFVILGFLAILIVSLSLSPPPDKLSEETLDTASVLQVQEDGLPPGMTRAGPGKPVELLQPASSKPGRVASLTGKVIKVADGDTITVLAPNKDWVKVRLEGIDAPEKSQEFGEASRLALSALVAGKIVDVFSTGKDRYGRTLGWIEVGGIDVNRRMVADGWAWQFTKYNSEAKLAQLQQDATRGILSSVMAGMPPLLLFMAFESLMRQIQDSLKPQDDKTPKKPRPSTKPSPPTAIPSSENKQRATSFRDQGWSKAKIAKELGVSPATVSRYLRKTSAIQPSDLAA